VIVQQRAAVRDPDGRAAQRRSAGDVDGAGVRTIDV
jgi:phosphoribosylformylglycinamidine (FGAM) synthase PurS component